jgi:hypothetical protein
LSAALNSAPAENAAPAQTQQQIPSVPPQRPSSAAGSRLSAAMNPAPTENRSDKVAAALRPGPAQQRPPSAGAIGRPGQQKQSGDLQRSASGTALKAVQEARRTAQAATAWG